ncbi:MAG TPA: GldG family protein [Lacunisphaera sp.]|nr:GldG family protein [Lacunisphaera sp.]
MSSYDSFRAARWIRFVNLVLQAVLFLSLFGGLNYLALNHSWRFDLTESRQHSLSAETRSYLEQLDRNIQIVVTVPEEGTDEEVAQAFRDISGLLREYSYVTRNKDKGRIDVRYVNVYKDRKEADTFGVDAANRIVLISDDRRQTLLVTDFYRLKDMKREAFRGESILTAALLDVSSPEKKKIYFLAGHAEMRPEDVDRRRGLSGIRDELRARNYEVASLDLTLSRKIPEDAALIVIASPQSAIKPFEEELLRNYLTTRAGRLILLLDPGVALGLENLLFDWGVIVQDNVIYDLDPRSQTENNEVLLWNFKADAPSHITDNLMNNGMSVIVSVARSVSDDLGRSLDDGLRVKKLIASSPNAWGESSYRLRNIMPDYTPGQDLKGELGVMVISERLKPADLPLSVKGGRVAVVGAADLVTNDRIITVGNLNLFLATVGWATERDTQLNIPARPIERFQLALSADELTRLRLGLLLGVPGVIALFGLGVYWTRRN